MPEPQEDPVVRSSRREAVIAMLIWVVAMTYSVGYCALYGYNGTAEDLTFVLGFPKWVFWGVIAPWSFFTVVSWWYAFVYMSDESLEEAAEAPGDESEAEGAHDGR